jgi:hypothetical protein
MKSKKHILITFLAVLFASTALFAPVASAADCDPGSTGVESVHDDYHD